ncbi:MAG: hypothetical protein M1816_004599 [Peltula sp. TS41687]|nr:MAG: hypothetical protein M1816_004599 [Peltula sp. TS41687]
MAWKTRPIWTVFLMALFVLGDARSHQDGHYHRRSRELSGYQLRDDYNADNFFENFDFFTEPDQLMVSSGMGYGGEDKNSIVLMQYRYVNESATREAQLISNSNGKIYIGADYQNVAPTGRASVRVSSKKSYERVMVIADIEHMPHGCGTWPALWTLGPNWPNGSELVLIQGVNEQAINKPAFHVGVDCRITGAGQTGNLTTSNCNVYGPNQPTFVGCGADDPQECSYGRGFNEAGGGVYAMDWTSNAVRVWFFSRSRIPSDISLRDPKPETWGDPVLNVQGGCNLDSVLRDQKLLFGTTFCGDWAGSVWSSSSCAASTNQTCPDYVANNPSVFEEAY